MSKDLETIREDFFNTLDKVYPIEKYHKGELPNRGTLAVHLMACVKRSYELGELRAKFWQEYYNPKDTRFKDMINSFVNFSDEQKQAIIELTQSLNKLNEVTNGQK